MNEHVLVTIFANAGIAFGNGPVYGVSIINIIKAFYHRNISFFAGWLFIVTTQVLFSTSSFFFFFFAFSILFLFGVLEAKIG